MLRTATSHRAPFRASREAPDALYGPEWALLKTRLQCLGVCLEEVAACGRRGGAGPAEGMTLAIDGRAVSVPSGITGSPYRLVRSREHGYELHDGDRVVASVGIPALGYPAGRTTARGTAYGRLALLHGTDCLASTVEQRCVYWGGSDTCAFCAIGETLARNETEARKDPEELAEVVETGVRELGVTHVTLTAGSSRSRRTEMRRLGVACGAIKARCDVAIQVQSLPVGDADLEYLHAFGADSIGIHIETLDDGILGKVAPVKAREGWGGYLRAWRRAVKVFGAGQVSTYIIVGLGEKELDRGRLEELVGTGVYPHVVPLRPSPGSNLGSRRPPSPAAMIEAYGTAVEVIVREGLSAEDIKAGCGRCRACSALPDFEEAMGT